MFFNLFYIIMTISCETESAFIRAGENKGLENIVSSYLKSAQQLSEQFPKKIIEMEIEIRGVTRISPQHPYFKRRVIRPLGIPRNYYRTRNDSVTTETANPTSSASGTTPPNTAPSNTATEVSSTKNEKIPIYLDDLKKALDEFAKKQAHYSGCGGVHSSSSTTQPHSISKPQSLQDLLHLIGKGIKLEYDVPKPTDDDFDWLQIKLPV